MGFTCFLGILWQLFRRYNVLHFDLPIDRIDHVYEDIYAWYQIGVRSTEWSDKMQKIRSIGNARMLQGSNQFAYTCLSVIFVFILIENGISTTCIDIFILFQFYRCMHQLADVMEEIIFSFVSSGILCICSSLLMIEKVHFSSLPKKKKLNRMKWISIEYIIINSPWWSQYFQYLTTFFDLLMPICIVIFGLLVQYILFYFGEKLHSDLMSLKNITYQTKWYRYPYKIRLFVLMMMVRAQKPFYLGAYGIIELNLMNFLVVSISIEISADS